MEQNSLVEQQFKLESQVREAFGKVVYSYTTHQKHLGRLCALNNHFKLAQIILSAITTGSLLGALFSDGKVLTIIGAVISAILLILNTYIKDFDLSGLITSHQKTCNSLWKVREEYISLLTDFYSIELDVAMQRRNKLQEDVSCVYTDSPRTDSKSYKMAQRALKTEEEQTFSDNEIDLLLPCAIRRNKNI